MGTVLRIGPDRIVTLNGYSQHCSNQKMRQNQEGLLGFTQSKSVIASGMSKSREPNWYPYTRRKYQLMGMVLDSLYLKKGLSKWVGLIKGLIGLKF